ncbi:MAG: tetratricopeptide repeat protein, partial [Myxococcota bacterium]|nr:tetratricopeptide repeat protein [Myxococcota bacterium]
MGVKSVKVPVGVALVLLLPFMVQCRHEAPRAPESDAARLLAPAPQQQPAPQAEPKWAAPEELCRAALQSSLRASKGLLPRGLAAVRTSMRAARYQEAVDILRFSLDSYEGAEADDARYLLGKLMSQAGEPGAAGYLSSLPQPFLPVEEERLYWLAKALLNEGEEDAALLAMDELNRRSKGSEAELESRLWKAALLWGRGDAEKARQLAAEVSKAQTHRGLKAQALRALVEYNRETATKTAAGLERDLLLRYPMEKATREPALSLGVEELSDGERFERAKTLIRHWGYAEAREELRRLSSHSKYGDDARWEVARIGISSLRDNVEEALEIYMDFASRAGPRQEEASFLVGRALGRLYRHAEALEALEGYLKRYRKGQFRERASYLLAWIAYDAKDCTVAEPRLQDWLSKHNDTVERGYYAWCKIRTGQWEEALTAFERLVPPGNPLVRGKARYWQAYALDQLGRRDEAREKLALLHSGYPLTYYDILGYQMEAQWDGRDARASQLPIFEGAGKASLEWQADSGWSLPKLSGSTAKTWSKVRRLVELDELERARKLYEPIRQSVEKSVAQSERDSFLLFVGDRLEDYHSAFKLASGGVSAMSSKQPDATCLRWQMAYPWAYAPVVSSLASASVVPV